MGGGVTKLHERAASVMSWLLVLVWAGLWVWGAVAAYGAAGIGGALAWLVLGGVLCLFGFIWCFEWFVERLAETATGLLGFALLLGFVWLVQTLWGVWL